MTLIGQGLYSLNHDWKEDERWKEQDHKQNFFIATYVPTGIFYWHLFNVQKDRKGNNAWSR